MAGSLGRLHLVTHVRRDRDPVAVTVPVIAIGAVTLERIPDLLAAGAPATMLDGAGGARRG